MFILLINSIHNLNKLNLVRLPMNNKKYICEIKYNILFLYETVIVLTNNKNIRDIALMTLS